MVQENDTRYEPSLQTEALLDPIRIAVQAFVGNVDDSSKQMAAAAEQFATDYARLIHVAGEARRQAAEARRTREQESAVEVPQPTVEVQQPAAEQQQPEPVVAHVPEPEPVVAEAQVQRTPEPVFLRPQDPAVQDLARSAVAVTQAASMAADAARGAAVGAVRMTSGEYEATNKRLQRVEEDIGVLTGLMRELLDRINAGAFNAHGQPAQPAKQQPAKISRRLRMRAMREARQDYQAEQQKRSA